MAAGAGLRSINPAKTRLNARAPITTPPINTPHDKNGFNPRIVFLDEVVLATVILLLYLPHQTKKSV
jgi:hypothetical protein